MANVEIDETEYVRAQSLTRLAKNIMAHPDAKKLLQRAHKLVDPNAVTPDLDAEAAVDSKVASVAEELKALKAERAAEKEAAEREKVVSKVTQSVEKGFDTLRRQGWTEDGINGVRSLMEEKGLLDVEDAATLFEKRNPPPAPATPSGSGAWNFLEMPTDGADDLKQLISSRGENEQLLRKMTNDALTDVRGTPRR